MERGFAVKRQRWTIRLPDDLPAVAGWLTSVFVCALVLAPVIAELAFGRPSSTVGVGLVLGSLLAILCGGAGFAVAAQARIAGLRLSGAVDDHRNY